MHNSSAARYARCRQKIYSCTPAHAIKHVEKRLRWICDIVEIIRALPLINWDGIMEKAHRTHSRRMLDVGLLAAVDLLDAPVPGYVLQRIKSDSSVQKIVAQAKWQLFEETQTPRGSFLL